MHSPDAIARQATSPLQVTSAAPFWRALRDESAIWMLTPLPLGRQRRERQLQHVPAGPRRDASA